MTEIGSVLAGKYRVLAKLGEGGMGSVFRAENQLTGKQVALKCLHAQATTNADSSERLLREARAASSLSHPNVVDVYDVVRDGETLFLVMELLQGQTLRDYLDANPRPSIPEILSLMLPAMAGVAAAHARGVIHRDLKPDNIFLARVADLPSVVVKVLDFGIAKLAVARGPTLTQTGVSLGTPLYMSLEQLRGDKDVDERTDVYAFGVMLYEALTGAPPYEAETLPELAIKVATTDPRPLRALRPDVPAALARAIDRAVARERNQRQSTLRLLQQELETISREHGRVTQPDGTMPLPAATSRTQQVFNASAPLQPAAASAVPSLRAEPDTFRVREVVSRAPPTRTRTRWNIAAAALVSTLIAGLWLLDRETPVETPALPLAPPNPLPAPGTSLSAAPQPDVLPDRAAPSEELPEELEKPSIEAAPPQAERAAVPAPRSQPLAAKQPVLDRSSSPVKAPAATAPKKKKSPLDLVGF